MQTAVKSKRITILGSPDFKEFLVQEAEKEGVSISELVRRRCEGHPTKDQEEAELLAAMVKELQDAVAKANASMDKGLKDAAEFLAELRARRAA
jgi:hypothetical protein